MDIFSLLVKFAPPSPFSPQGSGPARGRRTLTLGVGAPIHNEKKGAEFSQG